MRRRIKKNDDIIARVLAEIANGKSVNEISKVPQMPGRSTICRWIVENEGGLRDRYAQARELRAELLYSEMMSIIDDCPAERDEISLARLKVDTLKWQLSKMLPERFGDSAKVEVAGPGGAPVAVAAAGVFSIDDVKRLRDMLNCSLGTESENDK